jgi:hypothetical protein
MTAGGTIVTDQNDNRPGDTRPATYNEADGIDWDIVKAQARYEDLTDRDLYARSRAALEARGEYDPARHGTAVPEPLTVDERLELLANGEVLARYYRHPATLAHAVEAGASWEQIGAARGASAEQARQDYRAWAEGQHNLWTGKWGGEPGRFGLDDAGYAAAIARAAEGQLEPDPAEACGFGRNQPGPYDREAGR